MALQNQTTSSTKLDIPTAHRHDVLSSKQVIIGCGGGFRHECANRYSPVAQWMSEVDLALHDESQQYGNLDETAAIARLPSNCLVLWLGDHRQTPGGLRKSSTEAADTLFQVVVRYTGTPLSPAYPVAQLMKSDLLLPQNAREQIETLARELYLVHMRLGLRELSLALPLLSYGWPLIDMKWSRWLPRGLWKLQGCVGNKTGRLFCPRPHMLPLGTTWLTGRLG